MLEASQSASHWLGFVGVFLMEGGEHANIFLCFQNTVYFSVCTEERIFHRQTLYFANQPLPLF